jgi:hypothetical protein
MGLCSLSPVFGGPSRSGDGRRQGFETTELRCLRYYPDVVAPGLAKSTGFDGLRALGVGCVATTIASMLGAITAMLLESQELLKWSLAAGFISIAVPYVAFRWHLATSRELTQGQKKSWRYVAGWGGFGFIAAFFYLMRADRRLGR